MPTLVLLRHGESEWNAQGRFAGWVDVDLTARGELEARRCGALLRHAHLLPTVLHTSVLTRAIRTAALALDSAGRSWVPTHRHWRLNERHYGALQGQDRAAVSARYGAERVRLWRRSYDVPPPPIESASRWDVSGDRQYAGLGADVVPRAESLADIIGRLLPCWYDAIAPDLRAGETVLVVAHSNSLRALVAHLDRLSPREVLALDIPTAMPLCYLLDDDLEPTVRGGEYLEPAAAAEAAAEMARRGR
jgi:2,3-bisphosphoglycerate-dependent phosphoglycerate mutase